MSVRELAGWGADRRGPGEPGAEGQSWVGTGAEAGEHVGGLGGGQKQHWRGRSQGAPSVRVWVRWGLGGMAGAVHRGVVERAGAGQGRGHRMRGAGRGSTWQLGMGKGSAPQAAGAGRGSAG